MAGTVRQRARRANPAKPIYLPEARAAANAVGQVLVAKYGQQPWLLQIMEMVQSSVDRGIKQLSGTNGPSENAPGSLGAPGNYALPARTKEDVIRMTPNIQDVPADNPAPAADVVERAMAADTNDMFAKLAGVSDPATKQLGHGVPGQASVQPMREAPVSQSGLVMPNGQPATQDVSTAPAEPASNKGWLM